MRTHSPAKPVLIFVSSRRQTRLTALDLIAFLAAEDDPKQWLHMPEMEVCESFVFASDWKYIREFNRTSSFAQEWVVPSTLSSWLTFGEIMKT